MKAAFVTLGCKVNQYESEAIASSLAERGYEIVSAECEADVYVVNSCSVTAESDRKTRQTVRRLKRLHPAAAVVLTGCMPQAFPDSAKELTAADIVTGNKFNYRIPEFLDRFAVSGRITEIEEHKSGEPFCVTKVTSFRDRTRAELKIEDGCDRFCSYCIIPYARGRVRSKPVEAIKEEAEALSKNGYREIVLVGINLSAYGKDNGKTMVDAVRAAASPEGVLRVRLGSLEPDHITDEVIEELKTVPEFCPQFHISLQSGCDKTLKAMNRHYNTAEYSALCEKLRRTFPDASITTDVMVGFAGETEEDFNESLEFVKKTGFQKVHIFPYSRRPGTPAAKRSDQVPNAEKERRAALMAEQANKIRADYLLMQKGKTVTVIPEEHSGKAGAKGFTANYTPVLIESGNFTFGEPTKVLITGVKDDYCTGEATE